MSIFNLLKLDYWFSQPYIAYGTTKWLWVIIFLVLILTGLIFRILQNIGKDNAYKEIFRRGSNLGLTIGLLGIVWLFFRQERVPFLAWRFWLLFLIIGGIFWKVKLLFYYFKRLPAIRAEKQQRELKNKYLPK
ncbi:MAG: hypothetical protein WCX97_01380 [Candidatus Magasanikbacteria bacterium]